MATRLDRGYQPPPAFYFVVSVDDWWSDTSFQEVSGLKVDIETEDVAEGGQNRYVHKLPVRTKYSNLTLKRGVVTMASPFGRWLERSMAEGPIRVGDPRTIVIQLLNGDADPVLSWKVFGAYPLHWEHSALNAMGNDLLIETIELGYQFFQRENGVMAGS